MDPNKPVIFQYLDYRDFLKDFLAFESKKNPGLSLRAFSARILPALSSSGLVSGVLKGKRNLGHALRVKFARALQLKVREAQFFDLLVQFNQATDLQEKNALFAELSRFNNSRAKIINEGQYRFFTRWYYPVVWNYFGINQKVKNPSEIAAAIHPQLKSSQVEEAITLLLDLRLIKKLANGYAVTDNHLATEPEFRGMVAANYNQQFLDLAAHSINQVDSKYRDFRTMVFSVSYSTIDKIKERMAAFNEEVQEIIDRDSRSECIYTLGLHLYPNTQVPPNSLK